LEEYLKYVEKRIAEEGNRCDACLDPITCGPLIHKVESCIITPHVAYMLDHGFEDLLDGDKYEDLKRMYGIYGRVSAHKALCAAFKNYLKIVGGEIVGDVNKDDEMISCVISLKERMNKAVVECFDSNIMFMDALRDAFSHFINQRSNRPAELLAKYIDSILKSGGKSSGSSAKGQGAEEEVESALDSCLAVFRFIQGKDAFEAFYKKYLAKRLLFNRTSSIDSEKSAIAKLKAECGPHFTSKLEGMFKVGCLPPAFPMYLRTFEFPNVK
jgi:cullin-4